jgi:hypothetical protein
MENFKCPHCKKKIELGEVTKKQADLLAAQEIQKFKDSHKIDIETAKQEAAKKAKEDQKKLFDKEQKDKDLRIKQLEENKNKDIDAVVKKVKESTEATEQAKADEKIKQNIKQSEQRENVLKLKLERTQKDLKKTQERVGQGLTADQGSAQEITLGNLLKEVFEDTDDEITAYEKGEPGADWLQKVKNKGLEIGRILYESKKTKSFSKNWINKLQQDMKETKADVGIIFTTAVPREFNPKKGFLQKGNIFICNYNFEKLKTLADLQRKFLERLDLTNKNENKDNKKSALEFLSSADMQNLMGLIQNKMFGLEDIVVRQKKLTRDLEKNHLDFDGLLDEFFGMTSEFGLKKKEKK